MAMTAKPKKFRRCVYQKCFLPENNNIYWWQFGFIWFGVLCFLFLKSEFSFFNILLFLLPIVFDLFYNEVEAPCLVFTRKVFIAMDLVCIVICFVGITMFTENGITVSVSALFGLKFNLSFLKTVMFYILWANTGVPLVFLVGRPCAKNQRALEACLEVE